MQPEALNEGEVASIAVAAREAAARFPWYRARLRSSADGELQVPILREADLATTYYSVTGPSAAGGATYLTSGTSAGTPKRVFWPHGDHERYVRHRARLIARFGGDACTTACADLGTGHAADSALEIFELAGLRGREIDVSWPVERHLEVLRRDRPDLLYTMPMILERLVAGGGLGYVPRRIVVVGDLAPREWRRAMAERIGMDPRHILDVFGSIEVGAIAYSDDAAGGYLFHDHIVPEVIAPSEAGPADRWLLVLTSLERAGFPAVRYVSGDLVAGLRRFATPDGPRWGYDVHCGREGAELKHGEMLSLHAVAVAIAGAAPGVAWEIRRSGMEVVVGLDEVAYSVETADAVRAAIRAAHPSVDTMIRSGLVGDITVRPVSFTLARPKRTVEGNH